MFTTVLSKSATRALALLGKNNILPEKTYLAGGSALALQFGHRISIDFDFFTPSNFKGQDIVKKLEMPEMIEKINWGEVKEFFRHEVVKLADKYLK